MESRNNYPRSPSNSRGERGERGERGQNYRSRENSRPHQQNPANYRQGSGRRNDGSGNVNNSNNTNYSRQGSNGNMKMQDSYRSNNGSRRNMNKMDSSKSLNSQNTDKSYNNYNNNNYNNNNNNNGYNNYDYNNNNNSNNNYSNNNSRNNSIPNCPPVPTTYSKDNSYKQFNNNSSSSSSLNASATNLTNRMVNNSNTSLLQSAQQSQQSSQSYVTTSPFQNPYKTDATLTNTLDKYSKLKKVSPMKFYISIILSLILTITVFIIGVLAMVNSGLSGEGINDINRGIAQGYIFYTGFMIIAIVTGIISFIKKWNSLLITYCSFLCVSILYLGYFVIDMANISKNTVTVMEKRWKNEFNESEKLFVQVKYGCCGYLNVEDDSVVSEDCYTNSGLRKRALLQDNILTPYNNNSSKLSKRQLLADSLEEGGCAMEMMNIISSKFKIFIIIFCTLMIINIISVVFSFLNIREYSEIISELSNPFA